MQHHVLLSAYSALQLFACEKTGLVLRQQNDCVGCYRDKPETANKIDKLRQGFDWRNVEPNVSTGNTISYVQYWGLSDSNLVRIVKY